jgi:DNA-binding response OmpR family regulator
MVSVETARGTVLVISDDDELGGLLALNLRRRQVSVEQTDFRLASSARWLPATRCPTVVVLNVERPTTDPAAFLQKTRERAWLNGVPIVLVAENATQLVARLGNAGTIVTTKLGDIGAIVAATLAFLPKPIIRV